MYNEYFDEIIKILGRIYGGIGGLACFSIALVLSIVITIIYERRNKYDKRNKSDM